MGVTPGGEHVRKRAQLNIVAMREEDLSAVLEIERQSHADPWSENLFLNEFRQPFSRLLIACRVPSARGDCASSVPLEREVAGYICFWCVADEIQIHNVAVRETCRNLGIGRSLVLASLQAGMEARASIAVLDVRAGNTAAIELYRGFGFEVTGVRRDYYGPDGGNAILMQLSLEGFDPERPGLELPGQTGSPPLPRSPNQDH